MSEWVTIATFYYAHQAALLKGKIESEDILCNIKDELTATVNPLYFGAIGGIKVQVRDCDVEKVIPILKELGYNTEADRSYDALVNLMIRFTQKIPIINKYPLERRYTILIISAAVFLAAVLSLCYYSNR